MTVTSDALFDIGHQTLCALRTELAEYEVYVNPELELRRGRGLLCYYNLQDGHIYLSIPDVDQPRGKFELFFLRTIIALQSSDEIIRFLELLIPWLIAHEVGHHLRHNYGFLDSDRLEEERIACQFAGAFIRRRLTTEQKQELVNILERAIVNLDSVHLATGLRSQDDLEEVYSTQGVVGYVYCHMRWFYCDSIAQEEHTIEEFVQVYLG